MEVKQVKDFGFKACECTGNYTFMCYAHEDTEFVGKIARGLKEKGINIWYDAGIDEGEDWRKAISTAISNCSVVLVFISKALNESDYCFAELNTAQFHKKNRIPILIENVSVNENLAFFIGTVQYVNQEISRDENVLINKLYPIIINAYEGKKSDIEINFTKMAENVDIFLKNENWNRALEESNRLLRANAKSYLGWWCLMRTLTYNNKKVLCHSNNEYVPYTIDTENLEEIKKAYRMAHELSADSPEARAQIDAYYQEFVRNADAVTTTFNACTASYDVYYGLYNSVPALLDYYPPIGGAKYYIVKLIIYLFSVVSESIYIYIVWFHDTYGYTTLDSAMKQKADMFNDIHSTYLLPAFILFVILSYIVGRVNGKLRGEESTLLGAFSILLSYIFLPITIIQILIFKLIKEPKCKGYVKSLDKATKDYQSIFNTTNELVAQIGIVK